MLSLIAAVSQNNCIGESNKLPWYIPEDLKHFKKLTLGKTVLMGRKTWESIPEKFRPLPGRTNVVITRQTDYLVPKEVRVYHTVDAALLALQNEEVMIIGGAELYRQTIDRANTLYITHVHKTVNGDVFFPTIEAITWREVERKDYPEFSFVTYRRLR